MAAVFVLAAVLAAGCKDEVDRAIEKLGGTPEEQRQAINDISISGVDPLPKLKKAIGKKKLPPKVRAGVAKLLGKECEKSGDLERCALEEMTKALDEAEAEVATAIITAIATGKHPECNDALRAALDSGNPAVYAAAAAELEKRAELLVTQAENINDPAEFGRKEKLLKDAVAMNPRNRRVVGVLASLYSEEGMEDKALDLFDLAGEYVRAFQVIGPFESGKGLPFTPGADVDFGATWQGKRREVSWFEFTRMDETGAADFRRDRRTKQPGSAFCATFTVDAKQAGDAVITTLGDVNGVWLNGKQLEMKKSGEGQDAEARIPVALKKGENRVFLSVEAKRFPLFAVRVSDTKNGRLRGAKYGM